MLVSPLYVVAGPTAVGKGTVVNRLREMHPDLPLSISVTTREPRVGEVDGKDYFFVSEGDFDRMVESGDLLEWAVVHGKYRYGTPAAWVAQHRLGGLPLLLELDLTGARQVKARIPEAKLIFIQPPSWAELERRLLARGTESLEEQSRRLRTARAELAAAHEFDVILVNQDVDETALALSKVMGLKTEP